MPERFELVRELGRGGMGVAWLARDTETGQLVALKVLYEQFSGDPHYVARMEHEVETQRRVQSPYVVQLLGYGTRDGRPYLAMEYVDGPSLRQLLQQRGPLPWPEAKALFGQMLAGLRAAHEAGVLHRDVKPSNILITSDGTAKLADFGVARAADLTRLTATSAMLGTPHYMSPDGKPSVQSDLYSMGCVLYEMVAGTPPFEGDTSQEVLLAHLRDTPNLDAVPLEARPVLRWMLEKNPANRPPSAATVQEALASGSMYQSVTGGGTAFAPSAPAPVPNEVGTPPPPTTPAAGPSGQWNERLVRTTPEWTSRASARIRLLLVGLAVATIIGICIPWLANGGYSFENHFIQGELMEKILRQDDVDYGNHLYSDGAICLLFAVVAVVLLLTNRLRGLSTTAVAVVPFVCLTEYTFLAADFYDSGVSSVQDFLDIWAAGIYLAAAAGFAALSCSAILLPQPLVSRIASPVFAVLGVANGIGLYVWVANG